MNKELIFKLRAILLKEYRNGLFTDTEMADILAMITEKEAQLNK